MSEEHGNPQAGPGIGRRLEQAREEVGLSLRQVEDSTKIRARYLQALERGDFDVLPTVYVLGSLKTYADFLGLDGAALSRELRDSLEPDEPEVAGAADLRETGAEPGAAPVVSVGLDRLFVGMGILIVSVLAIMTLVSAAARYEEPKISHIEEPSVHDAPPGMALAGNPGPETVLARKDARVTGKGKEEIKASRDDNRELPKEDEKPREEKRSQEDEITGESSLCGDVVFVPTPPSSPQEVPSFSSASASVSASASANASASLSPASASPEPSVSAPTPTGSAAPSATTTQPSGASATPSGATVEPDYASASPAPASIGPTRRAGSVGAGSGPAANRPRGDQTWPPSRGDGGARSAGVADAGRISESVDQVMEDVFPER